MLSRLTPLFLVVTISACTNGTEDYVQSTDREIVGTPALPGEMPRGVPAGDSTKRFGACSLRGRRARRCAASPVSTRAGRSSFAVPVSSQPHRS